MSGTEPKTSLSPDAFERLLQAFDPDRDRAGELYESLRRKLLKYFEWRGAAGPEVLTDLTFDRVARKLQEGERIHAGEPTAYVYAVAKNILRESWVDERRQREAARAFGGDPDAGKRGPTTERVHVCLELCLARMPERSRELLLRYYAAEGGARIAGRRAAAEELRLPLNALRIRMHRLRGALETCIRTCLAKEREMDRPGTHLERGGRERP